MCRPLISQKDWRHMGRHMDTHFPREAAPVGYWHALLRSLSRVMERRHKELGFGGLSTQITEIREFQAWTIRLRGQNGYCPGLRRGGQPGSGSGNSSRAKLRPLRKARPKLAAFSLMAEARPTA